MQRSYLDNRMAWHGPRLAAAWAAALVVCLAGTALGNEWEEQRRELIDKHRANLAELAAWCDEKSLGEPARTTRGWVIEERPFEIALVVSTGVSVFSAESGEGADDAEWRRRFGELRRAQGAALFDLAERSVAAGQSTLAFRLVHEALREDPDHAEARRILGFVKGDSGWQTEFEQKQAQKGLAWHERFGWLAKEHVPQYEAGQRFYRGRWMSSAEEARLRKTLAAGWVIRTEHYEIRTNHSLEEAVRLAAQLESLYRVWRQLFVRHYLPDKKIADLFVKGKPPFSIAFRHKVVFYRTRAEYVAALEKTERNIGITTGYYLANKREAHFYALGNEFDGNLFHEATHQLFSETRSHNGRLGRAANFWAIEGVACYMESLQIEGDVARLGGAHAVRLQNARQRIAGSERAPPFYVPLHEMVQLGMKDLQARPDISAMYSQMAGLGHFFVHGADRPRREMFIDYLKSIYDSKDNPDTLAGLTGETYDQLDAAYRRFLEDTAMVRQPPP